MLQLRRWFDADFVPGLTPPGTTYPVVLDATVNTSASVIAQKTIAPVTYPVVLNATVSTAALLSKTVIPAPPVPYRVTVGNITQGGSIANVSITPDPLNPPQDKLNINFPTVSGSGGNLGVNALDFPGADLGAKINSALSQDKLDIFVPNQSGLVISTPVRVKHSMTLRFSARFPGFVDCRTGNKPVFEATDQNIRNYNIDGGFFQGNTVQTPSCFLLLGRNAQGTQQGDCMPLSNLEVQGHFGVGVAIHIAGEVTVYQNCILAMQGKGDSPWAGPKATIMMGNKDYWGVPFAYTQPNQSSFSTSANVFQNCTIGYDISDSGSGMLVKGQVEDTTVTALYLNSIGRCHVLFEGGLDGGWTFPRRFRLGGGGRSECNKGVNWAGVPLIIADGMDQGFGVEMLTLDPMGVFFGGLSGSVPVIQVVRGGRLDNLTVNQGIWVEGSNKLLESPSADLTGANINMPLGVDINCSGRTISDSFIRTKGQVLGTVASNSRVRSANVNNW